MKRVVAAVIEKDGKTAGLPAHETSDDAAEMGVSRREKLKKANNLVMRFAASWKKN